MGSDGDLRNISSRPISRKTISTVSSETPRTLQSLSEPAEFERHFFVSFASFSASLRRAFRALSGEGDFESGSSAEWPQSPTRDTSESSLETVSVSDSKPSRASSLSGLLRDCI